MQATYCTSSALLCLFSTERRLPMSQDAPNLSQLLSYIDEPDITSLCSSLSLEKQEQIHKVMRIMITEHILVVASISQISNLPIVAHRPEGVH